MSGKTNKINHAVFWPPFLILLGAVLYSFIDEKGFAVGTNALYDTLSLNFDWLYALISLIIVLLLIVIACSKAGKIRFGGENAKPHYTFLQWFAMSLCGGIAIGIVFWGVAEPITHLSSPAMGIEPNSGEAVMFSISTCYLNWTITPYGLYNLATIPIALAVYNYNQRLSISSGLYFIIGDHCNGWIGKVVDAVCIFAMAGGIATSLGMGIMQLGSGVNYLTDIEVNHLLWLAIAVLIVGAFCLSSSLGVDKGIKWLSDQNFKLYIIVLIFVFAVGPTAYICKLGVQGIGDFVSTFFIRQTYLGVDTGEDWARWWSVFYWAVWIAYAPVVGVFFTRLCYGRTVREFLLVNLLAPSVFGILWFTVFGGTAIHMQLNGIYDLWNAISVNGVESAVFAFFSQMPLGTFVIIVFLIVIFISFVTMADSMTYCAATLSTKLEDSHAEPPLFLKLIWGFIMGALAYVMICFAGVDGTKMLSTLTSFPLLFLMIAFIAATIKGLYLPDKKFLHKKKNSNL